MALYESAFNTSTGIWMILLVLISVVLWLRCQDARRLVRNTLFFILLSFIGLKLTDPETIALGGGNASIIHAVFVLLVGAAVIRLLGLFTFRILLDSLGIHPPSILEQILVVIAYFVWAMLELHAAGVPLGEIITTSAIATAVLAFAMQDTLGNILGGLALQWDHSLKVGDWIRVGDVEGKIVDIKWRAICLETRNWETVVIPNATMMKNQFKVLGERSGESVKWRRWIWFNIDYSVPPDHIITLAESAVLQAEIACVALDPSPNCLLMDIDNSTARYALRYWLTDLAKDDPTDSLVRQHIYAAFNRQRIRLAMPRQHLYLTNRDESYLERKHDREIARRMEAVSGIDLFGNFSRGELHTLAERMEYRPYAKDDIIFKEGDLDYRLYVITEGEASFHVIGPEGEENYAFSLSTGEIFGEVGLMTGEPRAATARAATAVECYALGKQDFASMAASRPDMIEEVSAIATSRQAALHRARDMIPHHADQPKHTHSLHELADKMRKFLSV